MFWEILMYTDGEWFPGLLKHQIKKKIIQIPKDAAISDVLAGDNIQKETVLFIAATDRRADEAKGLGMAVLGYLNRDFPGQGLWGLTMLVQGFEEVDETFLNQVYLREHALPWKIAVTKRCIIREFSMADMDALQELYNTPGVTMRLNENGKPVKGFIEPLYPPDEEKEYQQAYIANMYGYYGYGMWLVFEKTSGRLIGRAGLENREYPDGTELELGYVIAPKWQHRGVATEVCTAIMEFARRELDFSRLNALAAKENKASIALLGKLGFQYMEDTEVSGNLMKRYVCVLKDCKDKKNII